jgi:hypothetical protein
MFLSVTSTAYILFVSLKWIFVPNGALQLAQICCDCWVLMHMIFKYLWYWACCTMNHMHQSTYAVTINHDCTIAMRALEVQLWYFVYRIEHLCSQCRDTGACMSRWEKNRIILMQNSSDTIMCNLKSTHPPEIFLESIMQGRKILIRLLEYFHPFPWLSDPYVEQNCK